MKKYLRPYKILFYKALEIVKLFYYFISDYLFYISTNYRTSHKTRDTLAASIMLIIHQLEKGMSMKQNPRIFGGSKVLTLIKLLIEYEKEVGDKDYPYLLGLNTLHHYSLDKWSDKSENITSELNRFLKQNKNYLSQFSESVKMVSEPVVFDKEKITEFFFSRNSVRDFSTKEINPEDVKNAVNFAHCTPSACNRQTSRVHFYNNPGQMKALINNQLGDQGWCHRAKGIIVVTSNQNYFGGGYERYESLIDGGLFAMNLVWGLHLNHVGTCFKMFVREPSREKDFKKLAGIPFNEIPIVLILIGYYHDVAVLEPQSIRVDPQSIYYEHN
jgi:nitroreductase